MPGLLRSLQLHYQQHIYEIRLFGEISSQNHMPQIIMCPVGLALPRVPELCTKYPGGITLDWLMVHMMVHLKVISDSRLASNDTETGTAREVTELVLLGPDTV